MVVAGQAVESVTGFVLGVDINCLECRCGRGKGDLKMSDVCDFDQEGYCVLTKEVHCQHRGELDVCCAKAEDLEETETSELR